MKELNIDQLFIVKGGTTGESVFHGIALSAGILAVGAAANFWNPIGWGGILAGSAVALACVAY